MEFLKFSPLGQWELCKAEKPPKDDYTSGNQSFNTYRHNVGQLRTDAGTKGVKVTPSTSGVQRQMSENKLKGKVPTEAESQFNDSNPGVGN